ncbi:MAG: hypothetical protein K8F59_01085 [Rhodobacteraceae bacterium]|nr:hypothetical protein [Paracoccaceae bacterium]
MSRRHDRIAAIALAAVFLGVHLQQAEAALPPYWQSAREIEAIVGDPQVHDALKYEEPILSIGTTGDDVYTLKTPRCMLTITIVDTPRDPGKPMMVGPRQFGIEVGTADCE